MSQSHRPMISRATFSASLVLVWSIFCCSGWSKQELQLDGPESAAPVQEAAPIQQDEARPPASQEIAIWPPKSIMQIDVDPRDGSAEKPADRSGELLGSASQENWYNTPMAPQIAAWTAPNIYYQPLYFEDVRLERYGQSPLGHFDGWRSGALFYADIFALPWNALQSRPCSYDYPLGLPRPGADVPAIQNHILHRPK